MFFKKNKLEPSQITPDRDAPYWDDKTVRTLADSDRFDVKVTAVTRRAGYGQTHENEEMREPHGWEISGILTWPKLIVVNISFERLDAFGGWFYNGKFNGDGTSAQRRPGNHLPMLEIYLSERYTALAGDIMEALKTSILCGRKSAGVRFWKRKGEGLMSATDKNHGYSYGSRYAILGAYIWAEAQAPQLPDWAHPLTLTGALKKTPESWEMAQFDR